MADRQTEFIHLARGLAVEGEIADASGAAALHLLFHSGMRHHQLAVVQHIMAD